MKELKNWIIKKLEQGQDKESLITAISKLDIGEIDVSSYVSDVFNEFHQNHFNSRRVRIENNYLMTSNHKYKLSSLLETPLIFTIDNFLSDEECDLLIEVSRDKLEPSLVISESGSATEDSNRTSKGTGISLKDHDKVEKIEKKIAEVMNTPLTHGEKLQIMNYQIGDEFKTHYDYLPENQVKDETGGQRVSTFILYLNDVENGGATYFPKINYSVYPQKGRIVYFEYLNDKNQLNPLTLHSSVPVLEGEKWICVKMMRENEIVKSIK